MFAPTYFARRYFAPRYFPPGAVIEIPVTRTESFFLSITQTENLELQIQQLYQNAAKIANWQSVNFQMDRKELENLITKKLYEFTLALTQDHELALQIQDIARENLVVIKLDDNNLTIMIDEQE